MAEQTTWIKIDRNIERWRWYQDANTMRVFLHLLINANVTDHDFQNETIHRGELATSIGKIAESLALTYSQARTAIRHLIDSKEIASRTRPRYLVITILSYDKYQGVTRKSHDASQANDKRVTTKSQQYKNIKNIKNENNILRAASADAQILDYGGLFLSNKQWDEIEAIVGPATMLEYVDRVTEWLKDNPRQKKTHVNVLRTFLKNDGLL